MILTVDFIDREYRTDYNCNAADFQYDILFLLEYEKNIEVVRIMLYYMANLFDVQYRIT